MSLLASSVHVYHLHPLPLPCDAGWNNSNLSSDESDTYHLWHTVHMKGNNREELKSLTIHSHISTEFLKEILDCIKPGMNLTCHTHQENLPHNFMVGLSMRRLRLECMLPDIIYHIGLGNPPSHYYTNDI